jgi:hypothetical protein
LSTSLSIDHGYINGPCRILRCQRRRLTMGNCVLQASRACDCKYFCTLVTRRGTCPIRKTTPPLRRSERRPLQHIFFLFLLRFSKLKSPSPHAFVSTPLTHCNGSAIPRIYSSPVVPLLPDLPKLSRTLYEYTLIPLSLFLRSVLLFRGSRLSYFTPPSLPPSQRPRRNRRYARR